MATSRIRQPSSCSSLDYSKILANYFYFSPRKLNILPGKITFLSKYFQAGLGNFILQGGRSANIVGEWGPQRFLIGNRRSNFGKCLELVTNAT
jgi:hypothetical protein